MSIRIGIIMARRDGGLSGMAGSVGMSLVQLRREDL